MNIALIGFRGTGKTTIAKILAQKLNRELASTDLLIEVKTKKSIPDIVKKKGWEYFRDLESKVLKESLSKNNLIIDCGGGVVTRQKNINQLKQNAKVILLSAEKETIIKRIKNETGRPALIKWLSLEEEVELALTERKEQYLQAADLIIDTGNLKIEEIISQIIAFCKK